MCLLKIDLKVSFSLLKEKYASYSYKLINATFLLQEILCLPQQEILCLSATA